MNVSPEYLHFVMDRLSPLGGVSSRAMFGGYGIFHQGLMFALISEDILYFKVDDSNRERYKKAESKPFPHGISYWEVPSEVLEDNDKLHEWANTSIAIANNKVAKKKRP